MGQQQLLLIVLGVIIVGIAVAVGINMFKSSAIDANRNAIVSDLAHLASKAQQYYKKPDSMGGGGQDFNGFSLNSLDQTNDNGQYRFVADSSSAAAVNAALTGGATSITASTQTIWVAGWGSETGDDDTNPVKAWARITGDDFITRVVN
jgi:Tfp pilus assembly protein PilE